MIKAIFFDVDGTLVSFKTHKVPKSTLEAIEEAQKKGVLIFVATGRPKTSLYRGNNVNEINFDGYVTMNGQYCFKKNGEIIYKNFIPKEDISNLIEFINENNIPCNFFEEEENYINFIDERVEELMKEINLPLPKIVDINIAKDREIYQLNPYINAEEQSKLMEKMPNSIATRWSPLFVDVIPKIGGKHIGISKIMEYYSLKREEIMAFGDGGNDVTMIEFVGTGVAMGNAVDELKEIADYITDTVDNDGIAKALRYFKVID